LNALTTNSIPLPEADPQQLAMMTVNPPTASLMLSEFVELKPGIAIQNAANSGAQLPDPIGEENCAVSNHQRVPRIRSPAGAEVDGGDVVLVGPDSGQRVRDNGAQACAWHRCGRR
jgi:hypothetical protein